MSGERVLDGVRFGVYGNCLVNVWTGPTRADLLAVFDEFMSEASSKHADGVVLFVVIEPGSPLPSAAERKAGEATYARWGPHFRAVAQVVEGNNLWAVTARSIMTAMRLVQRRPYPTKVFSDVREGATWTEQYLDLHGANGPAAEALMSSINELRKLPRVA